MSRLVWNNTPNKRYEDGCDRGVLYPKDRSGVAWNGLVAVEESYVGGEVTAHHYDGVKYVDLATPRNFQAKLTAFSAPREFSACVGEKPVVPGFILTRQSRVLFDFSYRTRIGDGLGYKIHLVYNALASNDSRSYGTLSNDASPSVMSWKIDATPPQSELYRPSAHYMLDSTKLNRDLLSGLEDILYGTNEVNPRIPSVEELVGLVTFWGPVVITPNTATGLSALVSGVGDLFTSGVPGIFRGLPKSRLTKSATNGFYRLE